jgi:hypothetical protein
VALRSRNARAIQTVREWCCQSEGQTALTIAAEEGDGAPVKVLLEHGADPSVPRSDGALPAGIVLAEHHRTARDDSQSCRDCERESLAVTRVAWSSSSRLHGVPRQAAPAESAGRGCAPSITGCRRVPVCTEAFSAVGYALGYVPQQAAAFRS